jgi:hypothetical protein
MASRQQNEKRFVHWQELPSGGRRYWIDKEGALHGFQRMIKIVDVDEVMLQVVQEIYSDQGILTVRHQKYPVDTGHETLIED